MTIKDVLILKEAVEDLNEGKSFYNQKGFGVGEYFWDSLLADIESLVIYAGIHIKKYGLHRMLAKRFPYAVYYEVKKRIAYVIAVLPMRRDPAWIRIKLSERIFRE